MRSDFTHELIYLLITSPLSVGDVCGLREEEILSS